MLGSAYAAPGAYVSHRHPDTWQAGVVLDPVAYRFEDRSLEAFCEEWTGRLEELGNTIYEQCRPTMQYLLTNGVSSLDRAAARHKLIVTWRTWYSLEDVQIFGRELLRGLPGRTRELADGGVAHELEARLADIVRGRWKAYEPVLAYLENKQVTAFWPRRTSRMKVKFGDTSIPPTVTAVRRFQQGIDQMLEQAKEATVDQPPPPQDDQHVLAGFRAGLELLLDVTIDLPDRRVKPLLPPWSVALEDRLRQQQLSVLGDALSQHIERELREHAGKSLLFELGQDLPDEVRQIFDRLSQSEPRLSYVVLPKQN